MSEQDAPDADESTTDAESTGPEDDSDATEVDVDSTHADEQAGTEPATSTEGESDDEVDDALLDRVAESDPEDLARELASLRTQLDAKEAEIDELTEKLKRKQADFQNYKKRMEKRREEEQERATADLVTRMLDVRDNLKRALDQDEDTDIRSGVESTLRLFDDVLDQENVDMIEPEPGEDVDPHRHEVLVSVESDRPEGTIDEVHRQGYVMADAVLREAQVTVSDGNSE